MYACCARAWDSMVVAIVAQSLHLCMAAVFGAKIYSCYPSFVDVCVTIYILYMNFLSSVGSWISITSTSAQSSLLQFVHRLCPALGPTLMRDSDQSATGLSLLPDQ